MVLHAILECCTHSNIMLHALLKWCCTQSKMMLHVLLKWCCMHSSNDAAINVYSSKQPLLRKSTQIAIPPKQHFQAQKQTRPIRHFLWWMRRGQRWYSRYKEKQGRALRGAFKSNFWIFLGFCPNWVGGVCQSQLFQTKTTTMQKGDFVAIWQGFPSPNQNMGLFHEKMICLE